MRKRGGFCKSCHSFTHPAFLPSLPLSLPPSLQTYVTGRRANVAFPDLHAVYQVRPPSLPPSLPLSLLLSSLLFHRLLSLLLLILLRGKRTPPSSSLRFPPFTILHTRSPSLPPSSLRSWSCPASLTEEFFESGASFPPRASVTFLCRPIIPRCVHRAPLFPFLPPFFLSSLPPSLPPSSLPLSTSSPPHQARHSDIHIVGLLPSSRSLFTLPPPPSSTPSLPPSLPP